MNAVTPFESKHSNPSNSLMRHSPMSAEKFTPDKFLKRNYPLPSSPRNGMLPNQSGGLSSISPIKMDQLYSGSFRKFILNSPENNNKK